MSPSPGEADYQQALQTLKQGGIVAYPTETFYGLAVDPENDRAIAALYLLKKRETHKNLSLLVPDRAVLFSCISVLIPAYEKLITAFWPGPLTLIFPAKGHVFPSLTKGSDTLAIRISSHPVAEKLCSLWGAPLTATSANISGEDAFVTAAQVKAQWKGEVGSVLDGGPVPGGKGSTIVRCDTDTGCQILRHGVITEREIVGVLGT